MSHSLNIPHQLTANVKWLHKVALIVDGSVLLLKRAAGAKSRPNCWDLPGGNLEWPTTSLPASNLNLPEISREVEEETSVQIKPESFTLSSQLLLNSFFQPDQQIFTIISGWGLRLPVKPRVEISAEHTEYAWVNFSDLANYDFDLTGDFVRLIAERALQSADKLPLVDFK